MFNFSHIFSKTGCLAGVEVNVNFLMNHFIKQCLEYLTKTMNDHFAYVTSQQTQKIANESQSYNSVPKCLPSKALGPISTIIMKKRRD